ncbi:hypothetical protein BP6252_05509 [Coleophoma cylindrospora]|uniref:Uncharacterized protein n=1 Tax=Coleophoma cylindrospora TaxID=1849047 RepID=A0A3D8RU03_9HELO|nr:hypothetical protein BP6252_05509 [Coleophoma cylindrospora]
MRWCPLRSLTLAISPYLFSGFGTRNCTSAGMVSDLEPCMAVGSAVGGRSPRIAPLFLSRRRQYRPRRSTAHVVASAAMGLACLASLQPRHALPDDGDGPPFVLIFPVHRIPMVASAHAHLGWDAEPRRRALARTMKNITLASPASSTAVQKATSSKPKVGTGGMGVAWHRSQQAPQAIPSPAVPMLPIASGIPDLSYRVWLAQLAPIMGRRRA